MEQTINQLKDQLNQEIDIQKTLHYAKTLGNFIGLKKEKGNVQVTPQYVLISHFMFPSYIGRTLLLAATAAVVALPEENISKK